MKPANTLSQPEAAEDTGRVEKEPLFAPPVTETAEREKFGPSAEDFRPLAELWVEDLT